MSLRAIPIWESARYGVVMTTQITIRLPDGLVGFLDQQVTDGNASSRASAVAQALRREQRRLMAERDASILAQSPADADLDALAKHAAGLPIPDLD